MVIPTIAILFAVTCIMFGHRMVAHIPTVTTRRQFVYTSSALCFGLAMWLGINLCHGEMIILMVAGTMLLSQEMLMTGVESNSDAENDSFTNQEQTSVAFFRNHMTCRDLFLFDEEQSSLIDMEKKLFPSQLSELTMQQMYKYRTLPDSERKEQQFVTRSYLTDQEMKELTQYCKK